MGASSGDIKVAQTEADATTGAAQIASDGDYKIAHEQSQAVIEQAQLDSEARIKEAEYNYKAVELQSSTDLEIAKLEYEEKMEENKNEAEKISTVDYTNALANMRSADASYKTAEAKETKYELQYGGGSSGSSDYYYYG